MSSAISNEEMQNNSDRGTDRRSNHFKSFLYSFIKRRRKQLRRDVDDHTNRYVDVHEPHLVMVFAATVVLSVIDAMLTLYIISNGGEEVNPFMRYLLNVDIILFFWIKFCLTSFGMLFLVSHKYFRVYSRLSGYHLLYGVFAAYFVLINYELILISQIGTVA